MLFRNGTSIKAARTARGWAAKAALHPQGGGNKESKELVFSILAIAAIVLFGTVGYVVIEGWPWFDALYMTVITLATIGYGEVHPLSSGGRAFTIMLIITGVGVASVVFSSVTKKVLDRHIGGIFQAKKMQDRIDHLVNHTIFCGFGRLSRIALQQLKGSGTSIVVVDRDETRRAQAKDAGFLVLGGDVTAEETLINAGIRRAARLVTLLPKDSDNLYVVLTSRELNPDVFIISRAEDESGEKRLVRAGATRIVSPYRAGAQRIANGILRPFVSEFLDLAVSGTGLDLQIEEIKIPELSPLHGRTLQEIELRKKTNVMVAAIVSSKGIMCFNPSADTTIESGSTLIGLGFRKDFAELEKLILGEAVNA